MSDGLFEKMEADADAFTSITEASGTNLGTLVQKALDAKAKVELLKKQASEERALYEKLVRVDIPNLMLEMGLNRVDVEDNTITLGLECYGSIPKGKEPEAFAYLTELGHQDVIQNEVKIVFDKRQDIEAGHFVEECSNRGLDPSNRRFVHPQTLKKIARDSVAEGIELNTEVLGLFITQEAKIGKK